MAPLAGQSWGGDQSGDKVSLMTQRGDAGQGCSPQAHLTSPSKALSILGLQRLQFALPLPPPPHFGNITL